MGRIKMKWGFAIGLMAVMLFAAGSVWAGTIQVDVNDGACVTGTGQGDPYGVVYCSIQDAIDDSTAGDTIVVAAGTYAGFTVATANIEVRGAQYNTDPAGATTRGGTGDVDESVITSTIMITADNVTVNGFKTGYPINVGYDHAHHVNISYNISENADGRWGAIHLHGKAGESYNQCDFAYIGYNTISGTTSSDWQGGGIWTVGNDDVTIEYNHILNSQYMGIFAPNHVGDRNIIRHNTITNSGHTPIRFWGGSQVDISYNVVNGGGGDGIWVDQAADNSTVSYNQISNVTYAAVALRAGATGVNVHHNTITASGTGVEKHDDDITGITVNYNDIYGNSTGFGGSCTAALDAENNWWGDASGPYHATNNPDGLGDPVSNNVDFTPWWVEEDGTNTTETEDEEITGSGTMEDGPTGGDVTIDATAGTTHVITTAKYESNPGGTPSFEATGDYYDVHLDTDAGMESLTVEFCPANPGDTIYYWDAVSGTWESCSHQVYGGGCITVTITDATQPDLVFLTGGPFARGTAPPAPIPTMNEWGMIIISLLMAGSALWFMMKRRRKIC